MWYAYIHGEGIEAEFNKNFPKKAKFITLQIYTINPQGENKNNKQIKTSKFNVFFFFFFFFCVRLLSVLSGHSFFSSPPQRPMTSDFDGFSIPDFIHYIYFPILILEKDPVFPFLMFSAKQGNYLVPFL